ncbi:MAG: bifunctional riboflavin kinase/FAD synthetase [Bacteroidota bacterium]
MKVHQDLGKLPSFKNAVITIGSFDGVHLGHRKIIEHVNYLAKANGGESILITFHPHPRLVVYPKDQSLQLLNTVEEKIFTLKQTGLDHLIIVPFTVEFSQMTADEYILDFLVEKFSPKFIVIGYDHKFGLNRQGDIEYLKYHQEKYAYQVQEIAKQEIEKNSISSTKIRNAIQEGAISKANQLLGHRYLLTGEVIKGEQIGKTLGFPTANLQVKDAHKLIPPNGIYAVEVLHEDKRYGGMLYIGDRPSIAHLTNQTIEVNIFDFDRQIYGEEIQLELIDYIRGDMAFDNLEGLSAQLAKDKIASLKILDAREAPKQPTLQFAVVILNYNGKSYLETFLPTVLNSSYTAL